MLRTFSLTGFTLCFWIASSLAAENRGASAKDIRYALQWASEEPGYVAAREFPGVRYQDVVKRCLAKDAGAFHYLFALSTKTDGAASELQSGILAVVLKHVGDGFFYAQLQHAPKASRQAAIRHLKDELLEKTPVPYDMRLNDYPRTVALLKRSKPE